MKTSFCIITLNEEDNLDRCLRSCQPLADEIIVVDSGSTDQTEAIARKWGARWIHQPWLGFVGQKNAALKLASHEWVFSIDADEEISPALAHEIDAIRKMPPPPEVTGFSMPRCVLYDGKWIRHGDWYPDRLVRWFKRDSAVFEGAKVHERLVIRGKVLTLTGELHHYSFRDANDHWVRCQKYARLWAESQYERGRTTGPLSPLFHAGFRWIRGYLLRAGFLDGSHGWRIAGMNAREVALKYRLLRELQRKAPTPPRA